MGPSALVLRQWHAGSEMSELLRNLGVNGRGPDPPSMVLRGLMIWFDKDQQRSLSY